MVVVIARVHGLVRQAAVVAEAIEQLRRAALAGTGCVDFQAGTVPGETGEFLVVSTWQDEASMRAHFASPAYGTYASAVGPALAQPSDVVIHYVERTVHPVGDPSTEAARQG